MRRFAIPLLVACAAMLSTVPMARADSLGLTFTEYIDGGGSGTDTLTVNYNGTLLDSSAITGTSNDWTVDLSSFGITINSNYIPQTWVEAPGESGYNVLEAGPNSNSLRLLSEATLVSGVNNYCGTSAPLQLGVSCYVGSDGANNGVFASVNEVAPQTPEPASMLLIAAGLAGVGIARRRRPAR
ncbi:MAG TPA: PEP-CTERM sorting domain-containing protein [Bryobacteraceae bacterium]|nr:PEP-CTERM sorting domain-containing protein [Bryobacteraceae bacterium]